jgi:hypothetical protein
MSSLLFIGAPAAACGFKQNLRENKYFLGSNGQ